MILTCSDIESFVVNLEELYSSSTLHRNTVFVESILEPEPSGYHARVGIKLTSHFTGPDGDVSLSMDMDCGQDQFTADGHTNGTDKAAEVVDQLNNSASELGFKILPGCLKA